MVSNSTIGAALNVLEHAVSQEKFFFFCCEMRHTANLSLCNFGHAFYTWQRRSFLPAAAAAAAV